MKCITCNITCKTKSGLTRHQKSCQSKAPAKESELKTNSKNKKSNNTHENNLIVEPIIQQAKDKTGQLSELVACFKSCLDILRGDKEHLVGDEALEELAKFLIWRLVEPQITNGAIDVMNLKYYKYDDEKQFVSDLENVKFSNFAKYVKNPEKLIMLRSAYEIFIVGRVFSQHPKFNRIFKKEDKTKIYESRTIANLVTRLATFNFDKYEHDILGEAYENIFVDQIYGAGKSQKSEMGQFFTPPKVKRLLINLVQPTIKDNGEIESVCDPAAGTGGILNFVIRHYQELAKEKGISHESLREQLIRKIFGIEIKSKVFKMCTANMLINTGEVLPNVRCDDSIRKFHDIKVDTIIANPPFSVTIELDGQVLADFGNDENLYNCLPIKLGKKSSELLFLQMMIHCLNIGGRAAIVMLAGAKMQNATSNYNKVREYLLKSCDLHEVISCPGNTFTSTNSKTCILFFTKKKNRADVIKVSESLALKSHFCTKEYATKSVKFYDFNPNDETKTFVREIAIEQIANKKHSLDPLDYEPERVYKEEKGIKWTALDDLCEIEYGTRIVKKYTKSGVYPVYGGGEETFKTNTFNRIGFNIVIGRFGVSEKCVRLLNAKFFLNDSGLTIKPKDIKIISQQYLGYYMVFIQQYIYNCARGSGQKNLELTKFLKIKIPLVHIEKQKRIVEFLDSLFDPKPEQKQSHETEEVPSTQSTISNESPRSNESIAEEMEYAEEIKSVDADLEETNSVETEETSISKIPYQEKPHDIRKIADFYKDHDIFALLIHEQFDKFKLLVDFHRVIENKIQLEENLKQERNIVVSLKINSTQFSRKLIGQVCDFKNGKSLTKEKIIDGPYPVIGGGQFPMGHHISYNNMENTILCSSSGAYAGFISKYETKIWASDCFSIIPKKESLLLNEYLYIYLIIHQNDIYKFQSGACQPHVYSKDVSTLTICIPHIEAQKEIISYIEEQNKKIKFVEEEIKQFKRMINALLPTILAESEQTQQIDSMEETLSSETSREEKSIKFETQLDQIIINETRSERMDEVKTNGAHLNSENSRSSAARPRTRSKKVVDPAAPKKSRSKKAQPIQKIVIESDREDEDS